MDWKDPLRHLAPIPKHPIKTSIALLCTPAESHQQFVAFKLLEFGRRGPRHDRAARILGTFLRFLEGMGRRILGGEILAWVNVAEDKVFELVNYLVDALLLPFKAAGGKAPAPIHPLPRFFTGLYILYDDPSRRDQTELKRQCLPRDGYQCIYTGLFDRRAVEDKAVVLPREAKCGSTDCVHIIPFAFGDSVGKGSQEARASIWWTLYRYFPVLRGKIGPDSINQFGNVVTMFSEVRGAFGELRLSFSPRGDVPSSYEVTSTIRPQWVVETKSSICVEQHDAGIPLPNPEYFKVHHIIAQILEVSGLGREIDDLLEAAEEELDGSSDRGLLVSQKMLMHKWV